ncbi:MAG TPA: hypothetical protein VHN20_06715, partial [Beijerinckiaceae bacterium]|nr:hypothetical protein [Beijerinckiaceae bacterium]
MIKGQTVEIGGKTPYERWIDSQRIPLVKDFYIEDLRTLEVAPWEWKGARGAYLNLIGTGNANDAYVLEIEPGKKVRPQRVLFEEMYFVVEGSGATAVWNDENRKINFEWQAGSLFSPPVNTWRQHFNTSGSKPARLFAVTSAPVLINLFRNL